MLQIGNTIVSLDLIEKKFICDLTKCKGICCVHGDSGAPLNKVEVEVLNETSRGAGGYGHTGIG